MIPDMKVMMLTVVLAVLSLISSAISVLAEPSPIEKLDAPAPRKELGVGEL